MSTPGQNDPLVGKVLADRFEILSRIGEGGTGVVYKAKQITVDRVVAIKVLGAHVSSDPTWVKRFHNEARAAARLDHPNTVRLIDFGETKEGLLFIAMEFLHGKALSDEIVRLGKLPVQRSLRILSQVCQSLHEAHGQGIIHRDIKPDNVFLVEMKGGGDFVKVLDFSVAKMEDNAQQTRAGTVFGTPAYMSPEQARGVKLSPHSDIYACGIVAYEMLTGKPPFEAALPMEVVMMHLRQKPAPLVGYPEPVARLVMKALEKTPDRRQQSTDEMHRECLQVLDQLYPGQTPAAGVPSAEPQTRLSGPQPVQNSAGASSSAIPPLAGPPPPSAGPPPPSAGPPPPSAGPPPSAPAATPEQKTVYGQAAPVLPLSPHGGGGGAASRTQSIDASGQGISSTMFSQGPAGGTALSPQALVARQLATAPRKHSKVAAPKPLFWVGWALLGVSLGMLLHVLFT